MEYRYRPGQYTHLEYRYRPGQCMEYRFSDPQQRELKSGQLYCADQELLAPEYSKHPALTS